MARCTTFSPTRRMRARSCSGERRREKRVSEDGRVRVRDVEVPFEEWSVCLPEHHPGYVPWDEYLQTRQRLRANMRPRGEGGGAAREGAALLQGLVRCGRCGRRMQVAYAGTGGTVRRYACVRGHLLHHTPKSCQSLGGGRLEKAVIDAFLEAVTPAGVAATAGAIRELEDQHEQRLAGQRLALERAQYETQRAERQFDACEPENRLVARTLEGKLEEALAAAERERGKLAALDQARPEPLTDTERDALSDLARDLPRLWDAKSNDRSRPQAVAARGDQRDRCHCSRRATPSRGRNHLGGRRNRRAERAVERHKARTVIAWARTRSS